MFRTLRGPGKDILGIRYRGRRRVFAVVALSLALPLAALAAPAGATTGEHADRASPADEQSLLISADFDGDTPIADARVRVYAGGEELRPSGGADPVTTFDKGTALLQFSSLPEKLRVVVTGGRAQGKTVDGSLTAEVHGAADGTLVYVNPVTTVVDAWENAAPARRTLDRGRRVIEQLLGIPRILDDYDLSATDRWFGGDRFLRWAERQGSVGAGVHDLVRLVEQPGDQRRVFRPPNEPGDTHVAASEGASPPELLNRLERGNPAVAAPGLAAAGQFLNNLIDAANGAAGVTGFHGFFLGAALLVVKGLVGYATAEETATKTLNELSDQIAVFQTKVDDSFLQLRAEQTRRITNLTQTADGYLKEALSFPVDTRPGWTAFNNAKKNFLDTVHTLETSEGAISFLHDALIKKQGERGTPLIPAVRESIKNDRFFTDESSLRLQHFFSYYEWVQVNLAAILSEYYMLGGPCAAQPTTCSNPPEPDLMTATRRVEKIRDNIEEQRQYLPSKQFNRSDRNGLSGVFIDTKFEPRLMWDTDPTFRNSHDIPLDGTFSGCNYEPSYGEPNQYCQLNATKQFGDLSWRVPDVNEVDKKLFTGKHGDATPWLKQHLNVNFDFPGGSAPRELDFRIALWVRDWWTRGHILCGAFGNELCNTTDLDARQLVLTDNRNHGTATFNFTDPERRYVRVADGCPLVPGPDPTGSGLGHLAAAPRCGRPDQSTAGFIFWVHQMNGEDRKQYCGSAWDTSSPPADPPLSRIPALC